MTSPSQPNRNEWHPEGWTLIEPLFLIGVPLVLFSCWPAIFAHGYTDTGGWRWDIHSTVACSAWWGVLLLFGLIGWVNHRPKKTGNLTARRPAQGDGSARAGLDHHPLYRKDH